MQSETNTPPPATYPGIFLIAAATLLLQVAMTRIFSVSIWYHFAFLVVSVALFGFGASGVVLSVIPAGPRDRMRLAVAPVLFAISTTVGFLITNAIPFSPFRIANEPIQIVYFVLFDLLLTLPFFFAGATVALILRRWPASAGPLYAWDLVGASVGSLLLFITLPMVGAPGAVFIAAGLGFASAAALAPSSVARIGLSVVAALHLLVFIAPDRLPDVRIDESKPLVAEINDRGGKLVFTKWNALSRIDVVERPGIDPMILIDSAAMTQIARPSDESSPYLRNISTLVYRLKREPSVVIVGSGGGMDVQNALALGARDVTCVEINSIIIELVTGRYREKVGDVFRDPRVRLVQDEGRSYIDRMEARADVLQITLIDTWAAGASGAYSLTENYLYTVEAFRDYIEHLEPDGMLSITRWYFEAPRLATLAREALEGMGVSDPARHILVLQERISTAFLVKRTPFTPAEVAAALAFGEEIGGELLYDPLGPGRNTFYDRYLRSPNPQPVLDEWPADVSPVTDDSPFFFQMARWRDVKLGTLGHFTNRGFLEPLALPAGQIALLTALGIGIVLSLVLLAIPLLGRKVPQAGRWRWLGYFLALGLAFITVEIVLMQRFALFLGHPTYSVTIVLFAILLFSGLGSAWSGRRRGPVRGVIGPMVVLLPLAILLLTFAVPPVTRALIGLDLPLRLLLAIAFIGPVAFLMGMPFPVGIRAAGGSDAALVPWAWAANGCASVVGSVVAVLGAMTWTFSAMLVVAGVIYLLALGGLSRSDLTVT